MKLLIMQSSPASCHLSLLVPYTLLSTIFSNSFNLCSSLSVKDKISHPYETAGEINFVYFNFQQITLNKTQVKFSVRPSAV